MKIKLPKSRTLKTDLSIIAVTSACLYFNVEKIFRFLLGDSFDEPFGSVGIYKIGGYVLGFILFYAILVTVLVKVGRYVASRFLGVRTGVDYVDVDL